MAARLSHFTGIGVTEVIVSSFSNLLSQHNSLVSLCRLLHSTSAEERDIVTYFLDFQEIKVLPKGLLAMRARSPISVTVW